MSKKTLSILSKESGPDYLTVGLLLLYWITTIVISV